jgi:hypothetical protein
MQGGQDELPLNPSCGDGLHIAVIIAEWRIDRRMPPETSAPRPGKGRFPRVLKGAAHAGCALRVGKIAGASSPVPLRGVISIGYHAR